jgi:uncharacterized protein YyaL (SSP411 family)
MIEALARAGRALEEPRYVRAAERAADFIHRNLWTNGRLMHHHLKGVGSIPGYLDDYAFLGRGLVALYETRFEEKALEDARRLAREMDRLFATESGAYALAGSDAEKLLTPVIEAYDGAMPSGNSAAAVFLLRLGHLTGDAEIEGRGRRLVKALSKTAGRAPRNHLELLSALDFMLPPGPEIPVAGRSPAPDTGALLREIRKRYLPNAVYAFNPLEGTDNRLIPYLATQPAVDGRATAYVCKGYACRLPVHEPAELAGILRSLQRP